MSIKAKLNKSNELTDIDKYTVTANGKNYTK